MPDRSLDRAARIAPWLLVALAVPRIVRLLYPAVWIEDDLLLESSFAAARGLRPYLDFAHAQMPLLEWVAGLYIRVVGASHARMEILNAAGIYATSVLIVVLGRRAVGSRSAATGAVLYSCHSLVFRYHVWAREFFVSALVLGAICILISDRTSTRIKVAVAAALLTAACAIKLTALVAVAAICLFLAVAMRLPRLAAGVGIATMAAFGSFTAFCYWRYGPTFLFQAFLFHFLKGRVETDAGPLYLTSLLDVLGPLALVGAVALSARRRWNGALGLTAAVLAADLLFFAVLSPTAWGHNYLEAWPYVALAAGSGVVWFFDARRRSWLRPAAAAVFVALCLAWITPLDNEASLRGSTYGFGFVPRRELSELASALRAATGDREEVIAPSFIAFEANRLQAVRYPENYGVMKAGEDLVRSAGFEAARERFGAESFFDLINETSSIWNDEVVRAIAIGGRVDAFIPDSPVQLMPLVNASPAALSARGFQQALHTEHFALWLRRGDLVHRP